VLGVLDCAGPDAGRHPITVAIVITAISSNRAAVDVRRTGPTVARWSAAPFQYLGSLCPLGAAHLSSRSGGAALNFARKRHHVGVGSALILEQNDAFGVAAHRLGGALQYLTDEANGTREGRICQYFERRHGGDEKRERRLD
jgi:hypothetical protein